MGLTKQRCNLCGSENWARLINAYSEDLSPYTKNPGPHPVVYYYCRRCSFVTMGLDYDEIVHSYATVCDSRDDGEMREYAEQEVKETESVVHHIKELWPGIVSGDGKVFLDVGCGGGGSLKVFNDFGWHVIGLEPGRRQSQFARDVLKFDVKTAYYDRSSFVPESIDFIYCYHMLEHVPRPLHVVGSFLQHLRPGGIVYVETPNVLDVMWYVLGPKSGHISLFSPATLSGCMAACGFEILSVVDRSSYKPYGVGVLARKSGDATLLPREVEAEFLPAHGLSWRKDSYANLWVRLNYGFYWGRLGNLSYVTLPLALGKIAATAFFAKYVRKSPLKRHLSRLARRMGYGSTTLN